MFGPARWRPQGEQGVTMLRTVRGRWAGVLLMAGLIGCQREPSTSQPPTTGSAPASQAGAGRKNEMDRDAVALQGRWEVVSSEFEGKPASAAYRPGTAFATVIVIGGDELYFTDSFTKSNA